ncbi:MAG: hypothetical protein QNJ72_03620 [Pleurocapsa sp. MO_226.B13]|nr:hypothetical protein [Pleurocapsa sp. MO_226.B13]
MNFNKLLFGTLAMSVLFFLPSKNNFALSETSTRQKINYQKPLEDNYNIVYSQAITHVVIGPRIITQFSPRNQQGEKIDLSKLASKLGYDHFNWVSYVETDPHGIADRSGKLLSTPYNDPPRGGYQYDSADNLPFYWDVVECDRCLQRHHVQHEKNFKQYELVFEDAPADYRLQPGEAIEFITSLVGVKQIDPLQTRAEWDVLHTFRWKLTNPRPNYSQVSLVEADVELTQLSPLLLNTMLLDGAVLPASVEISKSKRPFVKKRLSLLPQ